MNKDQAIALANTLANEAEAEEIMNRAYYVIQAANQMQWAVREDETYAQAANLPIQVWISPELSFPL